MSDNVNIPINNFNSGELGPLLESRFDINKYASGCQVLENAFPMVEGGAKKMPGTYYAGATKSGATYKSRLVPFSFSSTQSYILEFGQEYIRFWKNGGLIVTYDAYTKLMLHCDGTPGSTTLLDSSDSGHPVTALGYSFLDSTQAKFGTTSVFFDGTISWLSIPDSADWNFGSGAVTIDFWVRFNTVAVNQPLFQQWVDSSNRVTLLWSQSSKLLEFKVNLVGISEQWNPVVNTWYHIAVIRGWGGDANAWAITVDGVLLKTASTIASVPDLAAAFEIGRYSNTTYLSGWIDEFRVSKGIARWTVAFTPETVPYTSATPYEKTTPYQVNHLFDLDVSTQSADVLYITHPSYEPYTLSRVADANWSFAVLGATGTADVAKASNGVAKVITGISKAAAAVVTCIAHGFSTNNKVYINGVAGMVEVNWGVYTITKLTADTFSIPVDSTGYITYTSGGYAALVSDLFKSAGNYPACGTFYDQRLVLAGSDNYPQRINGSVQADFPNFICDPNQEDYAIQFDLISTKIDRIRWVVGSPNALLLGTAGGVWAMLGSGDASLTQINVNAKKQISTGVGNVAPQIVNDSVIWVTRSAHTVRLLLYNFITNQWESPDLTRLNRDITKGPTDATSGIVQTAFQAEPYPIFWAVRADGQLIGMTYERQEQVYAWFRVVTDGVIESVAVISNDNAEDQIWVIVNRTIEGNTVRYVEYFMPQDIFSDLDNAFFVHSGLQWNGGIAVDITAITKADPCSVTATNHGFSTGWEVQITGVEGMTEINQDSASAYTITVVDTDTFTLDGVDSSLFTAYTSGGSASRVTNQVTALTHLAGKEVVAVGDGALIYQDTVPTGGTVDFDYYANLITIGLPYTTTIMPMNPVIGTRRGTSRGSRQKIHRATLCFYETMGCKAGLGSTVLYEQTFGCKAGMDPDTLYDVPMGTGGKPTLYTGDVTIDFDGEWDDQASIAIVHDQPFPFTLKAVIPRLDVNES